MARGGAATRVDAERCRLDNGVVSRRSYPRQGDEGDAVRVLAPDLDSRSPPPVDMASTAPPPSSAGTLVGAAVLGVLGFVALLISTANDSTDETSPLGTLAAPEIAAAEAVGPGRTIDVTASWAAGVGIAGGGEVADAVVGQARLVAAGATGPSAAVWASTTGKVWEAATDVETPIGSASRIETIAYGKDGWIGVGAVDGAPAVWRAEEWESWQTWSAWRASWASPWGRANDSGSSGAMPVARCCGRRPKGRVGGRMTPASTRPRSSSIRLQLRRTMAAGSTLPAAGAGTPCAVPHFGRRRTAPAGSMPRLRPVSPAASSPLIQARWPR